MTISTALEDTLQKACEDGQIFGAAVLAATVKQGVVYSKAFGNRSLEKGSKSEPLKIDDTMLLASASKLVTSVAALQVVEKGLVDLDEDLARIIPELASLKVLKGMDHDSGSPIFEERTRKITLRQLLSHSSGLTYAFLSPLVMDYNKSQGLPPAPSFETVTGSFAAPLTYQPGTSWEYSSGIEWAGHLVKCVTGTSLEDFTQKNIAEPLGIEDMTYLPKDKPSVKSRLVSMARRDPSVPDGKGKAIPDPQPDILANLREELGGISLHMSMQSYIKILHSLLANDEKLLRWKTVDLMFEPQLTPAPQKALQANFDHIPKGEEGAAPPYIGTFPQVRYDHGLGGMLSMEDVDSGSSKWRRKGYFFWSGMPNLFWFIDREAGLCGVFGTQLLPNADEQVRRLIDVFEKEMYARFAWER